jgi:hypothetical protein
MFNRLFERPHAIQRQINAPLLEDRLRYLTFDRSRPLPKIRSVTKWNVPLLVLGVVSAIAGAVGARLDSKSSQKWHEGEHDLRPWWNYFIGMLTTAYKEFEERVGKGIIC